MEGPVNGVRMTFFRDLTEDYLKKQKGSFLYRTFWGENMKGLLKAHFSWLPDDHTPEPSEERRLRRRLSAAMAERPEWARSLLLREEAWKQRRNLWEELWLNDLGYQAGLITDTEYYLWLVEYLAAHDIYKTNIYYYGPHRDRKMRSGHRWLYGLLQMSLKMELSELKEEIRTRKKTGEEDWPEAGAKAELSKTEVEEALAMLAQRLRDDRDKTARRLHKLRCTVKTKDGAVRETDYLPWLTGRLEQMALHIKIKNWLQDSGYPLIGHSGPARPAKEEKKARKTDFSMRLFEAYCDSAEGYELRKKARGGGEPGSWRPDGLGFCVLDTDPEQLKSLLDVLEEKREGDPYLYLPLAVHLHSGCVFFLAGKANYEQVYQNAGGRLEAAYKRTRARYCFDYLRLVKDYPGKLPGGGAFCLSPAFHTNAFHPDAPPVNLGKKYKEVLDDFKTYCTLRTGGSPFQAVREYNGAEPAGIPKALRWAFDDPDD